MDKDCCTAITVTIDCTNASDGSAYPANVPKPQDGCKQVNKGERLAGDKVAAFERYYNEKSLSEDKARAIAHSLGLSYEDVKNMNGTDILSIVERTRKLGKKIEYHHIRPDWAGGDNTGDNLVPILFRLHKGEGSAHRWWSRKIEDKENIIQGEVDKCLKKNGDKPFKHIRGESGMKKTAKHLDDSGVGFILCLSNCKK